MPNPYESPFIRGQNDTQSFTRVTHPHTNQGQHAETSVEALKQMPDIFPVQYISPLDVATKIIL